MCKRLQQASCVSVVTILFWATLVSGQAPYPIYTASHLASTMESLGPNFRATMQFVDARNYPAAKERVARAREQLATTVVFWRQHEIDDATRLVQDTVALMDLLDHALSVTSVDQQTVLRLASEIRANCDACHQVYREEDPATGELRLKAGFGG